MKFKIFLLLSQISIAVSSKLPQSACKIVTEEFEKEPWMKTIAIVKFENNFQPHLVDDLLQCLPASKILIDAKDFDFKQPRIHNADMVIFIADKIDNQKLFDLVYDLEEKPFLSHNIKFLILTSNGNDDKLIEILDLVSITNFGIIKEDNDTTYHDHSNNLMNNLTHKIVAFHSLPRVNIVGSTVHSNMVHFLEAVSKVENSNIEFTILNHKSLFETQIALWKFLPTRDYQMILNTFTLADQNGPGLMIYEEKGFCPLVPVLRNVRVKNASNYFLANPNDIWTMIAIVSITIAYMILWRLGGHSTSVFFIPFFFWSFYFGQSMRIHTKKKIFVILLQISVFVTMFHSFLYQAIFTSLLIVKEETPKLTSLDELFMSEYTTLISLQVKDMAEEHSSFYKAEAEGRIMIQEDKLKPDDSMAVLMACERAKYFAATSEIPQYVIEENLFRHYVRLHVSFLNKHLSRWQLIMDRCFEAGLPQAWKTFDRIEKYFKSSDEDENTMMNLDKILIACKPVFAGWIVATFVLILEIFWHDFVVLLYKRLKMMRRHRVMKVPKRKLRVRRIQVKPANVEMNDGSV